MQRLIYASRAVAPFDEQALVDLLGVSRERNSAQSVTGLLLYCQRSFLQVLEGSVAAVDETYDRIVADGRHEAIRLLAREPIDVRAFPDWTMGFHHPHDEDLQRDVEGYRIAHPYPLVAEDVIPNAEVAFKVLELYGRNGASG